MELSKYRITHELTKKGDKLLYLDHRVFKFFWDNILVEVISIYNTEENVMAYFIKTIKARNINANKNIGWNKNDDIQLDIDGNIL